MHAWYTMTSFTRPLILAGLMACGDLPPTPENMPVDPASLPNWDTIEASTHTKASRPPEPVLIVDRTKRTCFKSYSVFPQEYRLPNGQAYSIRDCSEDCGTAIACPPWAQDVQSDFTRRKKRNEEAAKPTPTPVVEEIAVEPTPVKPKKGWPSSLGPPPTEAPKEPVQAVTPESEKGE
jgi:hypothetical protein